MPQNIPVEEIDQEVVTETKFFANEVIFHIGDRGVKLWELIVGLIVLSMLIPLFYRRRR